VEKEVGPQEVQELQEVPKQKAAESGKFSNSGEWKVEKSLPETLCAERRPILGQRIESIGGRGAQVAQVEEAPFGLLAARCSPAAAPQLVHRPPAVSSAGRPTDCGRPVGFWFAKTAGQPHHLAARETNSPKVAAP